MSVRQKVPEDLTARKALALEVIDRLKKSIRMPDAPWTTPMHGSCLSVYGWPRSVRMPA